ncbi:UGT [Lepeophtheirus salmonis]|uniref:UGT n=1 Tax=Lepeophtheirus salmonis TaxID=72036 RepID=A0A7R8D3P4_LEPSM|nr:UGT [Lepeophtheirus salmonis]CAF3016062.1 UGT [Lepeophtheirus salmonis]
MWHDKQLKGFAEGIPVSAGRHVLTLHSVASKLIERGHRVTTIRFRDQHNLTLKSLGPRHKEILLAINNTQGNIPFLTREEEGVFQIPMDLLWNEGLSILSILQLPGSPWKVVEEHCAKMLNSELIEIVKKENFDLMVVDLIYNECSLALAYHLNIPTAGYWAFSFSGGEFDGYIAKYLKTEKEVLSSEELISNVNGLLINTNDIIDYPRLKADTAINIGGMQIRKERQKLPKELEEWIDGAPNGVILLSMGFIFDMAIVPEKMMRNIFNAFSRLPFRFIVKIESQMDNLPNNIYTSTFLPQQDILDHPKTIAFFTHTVECMESLKQFTSEEKKIALILSKFATEEEIYNGIIEVTSNQSFTDNVRKLSTLFKMQRNHPIDDAVWFLEYLSLTKGAKHMLMSGRHLNIFHDYTYKLRGIGKDIEAIALLEDSLKISLNKIGIIILKWTKDVQSVEGEAFVNAFNNILSHYIISLHSVVPIFYYMDRYSREIDLMRELLGSFVDKFANPNIIKLFVALNQMDPSSTSNKIIIQNLFEKLDNLPINYSTSTFQFYKKLKDTKIHCCNMELTQCFPQKRSHNAIDEDEPVSTIARY